MTLSEIMVTFSRENNCNVQMYNGESRNELIVRVSDIDGKSYSQIVNIYELQNWVNPSITFELLLYSLLYKIRGIKEENDVDTSVINNSCDH